MALLFPGFALSEVFRAPTSVMVQETASGNCRTTAAAFHLCVRNLVGGLGPLVVSAVAADHGIQRALLLAPAAYVLSAATFFWAGGLVQEHEALRLNNGEA